MDGWMDGLIDWIGIKGKLIYHDDISGNEKGKNGLSLYLRYN